MPEREYDDYYDQYQAPQNPWTMDLVNQLAGAEDDLPPPNTGAGAPTIPTTRTGGGAKTPAQIEAEGREADRLAGRIGGYMMNGVWVNGSPSSSGVGAVGGGVRGPGGAPSGAAPDYGQMLPFSPYEAYGPFTPRDDTFEFEPFTPREFSYEKFAPSSYADLEQQPGFLDGQQRLQKQIEAGAAYRGMVRSGMTLGDLWSGLDTNKQQRFAEFDGRRARDYTMNRGNAFDNFRTNEDNRYQAWGGNLGASREKWRDEYNVDKDRYSFGATENDRKNNFRFNTEKSSFDNALERWRQQVQSLTQIATAGAS